MTMPQQIITAQRRHFSKAQVHANLDFIWKRTSDKKKVNAKSLVLTFTSPAYFENILKQALQASVSQILS